MKRMRYWEKGTRLDEIKTYGWDFRSFDHFYILFQSKRLHKYGGKRRPARRKKGKTKDISQLLMKEYKLTYAQIMLHEIIFLGTETGIREARQKF